MLRQALSDSLLYAAGAVLPRGVMLVLLPVITRVLGPSDYGALDLLTVFGVLVQLVIPLEVSQGLAREWTEARDRATQRAYASSSLWFSASAYALFAAAAWAAAPSLAGALLDDSSRSAEIRAAIAAIWLGGLVYLAQQQLRWDARVRAYMAIALLQGLAVPGLAVTAAALDGSLLAFLYGQIAGHALVLCATLFLLRDVYGFTFSARHLRSMLAFSLPLVPSGLAVVAAQYADRLLVKELLSLEHLGAYGVAARTGSIVALAVMGLQLAVTPLVYRHAADPVMPGSVARLFGVAWGVAVCAATALGLFADEVVRVLAGPGYGGASAAVYLLALAAPIAGMYVYAPGLALARRTVTIACVNAAAAGSCIALGILLIPRFGLTGAAAATLTGASLGFALHAALGRRHAAIPYPWTRAGVALAASLLAVSASLGDALLRAAALAAVTAAAALLLWPRPTGPVTGYVRP